MTSGAATVSYSLYTDAARTTVWGNTGGTRHRFRDRHRRSSELYSLRTDSATDDPRPLDLCGHDNAHRDVLKQTKTLEIRDACSRPGSTCDRAYRIGLHITGRLPSSGACEH
jgi:hypothetical protein